MNSFKHWGKIGDIIFSIPTIERLGGGVLYIETGGLVSKEAYNSIRPLLMNQDCIEDVREYTGGFIDYDLTAYVAYTRLATSGNPNYSLKVIPDNMLAAFSLPPHNPLERWLKPVPKITLSGKTKFVSLTPRYFNDKINWGSLIGGFADECVFVGLRSEWVDFCVYTGLDIHYLPTEDFLELQRYLEGAERLYCCQSGVHALGEGIKMPLTLAVSPGYVTCIFPRPDAEYIYEFN